MHRLLSLILLFTAVGAYAQTTTDCNRVSDTNIKCTTTENKDPWQEMLKQHAERRAAQRQAAAAAEQAEASCVAAGGTSYEGHCLTQEQYGQVLRAKADKATAKEAQRQAKIAAKEAKHNKNQPIAP